ncbi:MAG: hypoxanthine phosphoribosyltransferase [Candidatus Palauibacterales bacterium]|jgi:hypoxanthine phosphoribosyltransferase|nr:hypoxanthine phosphoribosyltransferase [Candidatus Palauibacterales bacterium]MDP2484026.1 hypoxanthine phosphoribosyltransferase [Candidatus Palauibacterales bacterium]
MAETQPRVLVSQAEIRRRVVELAGIIERDYADAEEILLLGVLRGAFIFLADLARELKLPRRIDFIALSSYENGSDFAGGVRLIMDSRINVTGKHVLIVEDILDSGRTLAYLLETFEARHPASLRSCVLVRKPGQEVPVDVDYVGFDIPDEWVVGYGLDFGDHFRALPYIGVVEPAAHEPG